ncbi:g4610 [Coccomyxa elongata]
MTVQIEEDSSKEQVWIFGFGSLIWKAGFEYSKRVEGYIKDYRRVFYQGSTDHRGTPEAPGRVVTLELRPGERCWGAAYLLAGTYEEQQKTLQYLEWREKQYDLRVRVDMFGKDSSEEPIVKGALTYIASEDHTKNLNYLGIATGEVIAQQIASAVGPSGPNYEYLYGLAQALEKMGVHEVELVWLAARVRQIRSELDPTAATGSTATTANNADNPEDALMQEYHRRAQSAASSEASDDSIRDHSSQQRSSNADTSTRLNAEKDLQFVVAQGSSASLRSTAGQEQEAPT